MKSNKCLLITLILVSLAAFSLSGCSGNIQQPSTQPTQPNSTSTKPEVPNPMSEWASLSEIQEAIGFTFDSLPENATDVKYYTIADNLAQADLTSNGVKYTVRKGASSITNVSGVYTSFKSSETKPNAAGAIVLYQTNLDGTGLATWAAGNYLYSVYCESGYDFNAMESIVNGVS
jgi:hypothetical protein